MHQPVDNFDEVIDRAVEECYAPFFSVMRRYPDFKFAVHCSGWLLEKICDSYEELYEDILYLSDKGSIEWIGAGYYEPILSSIPSRDRRGQIEMLNRLIGERFGKTARGMWLTERVWDSSIVSDMKATGMEFAMVDDYHFIASGMDGELDGYYLTEEGGETVSLFPISKELRYAIPFKSVESAVETVIRACRRDDGVAVIFDDAEKFGMWPGTAEWVYAGGWLESFVTSILQNDEIETIHFSEYMSRHRPIGLAYLPNVSYFEMGEWSLKAREALSLEEMKRDMGEKAFEENGIRFLKGGIWKNFLLKYEESNRIHKRMLEVSALISETGEGEDALYRLQTNDVLWHGVFGGLYLPNLRDNAYRYLAECEDILRRGKRGEFVVSDTDMNGYEEVSMITDVSVVRFDSRRGGQMVELLDIEKRFNYQNVLTRREEAYHKKIESLSKETPDTDNTEEERQESDGIDTIHDMHTDISPEISEALSHDWYIKNSFVDHIGDDTFTLENFKKCSFWEYGDFADQPFEIVTTDGKAIFERAGGIYYDETFPTVVTKSFGYLEDGEGVSFEVDISTQSPSQYRYALEFNLHFANLDEISLCSRKWKGDTTMHSLDRVTFEDPYTGRRVTISTDCRFDMHIFALETVTQSESGYEITVQGVSMALLFPLRGELKIRGEMRLENV